MATEIKTNSEGLQHTNIDGQEWVSLWLPLTVAQRDEIVAKAKATGTNLNERVASILLDWLQAGDPSELSLEDMKAVTGGVTGVTLQPTTSTLFLSPINATLATRPTTAESTWMCAW